jgi:DNA-binding NarL/FixJ family response regulator
MAIRVLLVDDQEMVRAGFAMILDAQADIEVVGAADDGERAIAEASRLAPDVIVMDIRMPKLDGTSPAPPAAIDELTPREKEVLALLARGLSNAEIAERLIVSRGTVKTHVERVLMKLDLRDRIQAVVLAYETGLITPGQADHENAT